MSIQTNDARDALIVELFALFRARGYDGVSIGDISAATGLGRSSLYHHFPGGKEEMAAAVIAFARAAVLRDVIVPLEGEGDINMRVDAMLEGVRKLYQGGPCVLASLLSSASGGALAKGLADVFALWLGAMARALDESGRERAREKASAALALIQGGLVLARALDEPAQFDLALASAGAELKRA